MNELISCRTNLGYIPLLVKTEVQMIPSGMVYRTNGGILDMYFFLGPEPETVSQQYMQVIPNFLWTINKKKKTM